MNKNLMKPQRHRGTEKNINILKKLFNGSVSPCLCGKFFIISYI